MFGESPCIDHNAISILLVVYVKYLYNLYIILFYYNPKLIFSALDHRHTQRRSGNGSDWSPDAPVLFIR